MKNLKKTLTVLTASMAVLSLAGCNNKKEDTAKVDDAKIIETQDNQIANPWSEVNSIAEAKTITGFDFIVPDTIDGKSQSLIQVMNDEIIEVRYGDDVIIRKSKGNEDNSGDFNSYDVTKEESIEYVAPGSDYGTPDGITLTLKGDGDTFNCVTWARVASQAGADYSYSITCGSGLSFETITEVVNSID